MFYLPCRSQAPRLAFEHLTMEQGLPSNDVDDILQDREGYLWAATAEGLARYDGYGFITYKFDPRDPHSLSQNLTLSLFEDPDGDLWVGNIEGGVNKFDRNTEKFVDYRPPQPAGRFETALRSVSAMNVDSQGYFWIGSYSGELRRFDKRTSAFSSFDYDLGYRPVPGDIRPFDRIKCIYKDHNGDLWIGNKSGLHLLVLGPGKPFDRTTVHFKHYMHDPADTGSLAGDEVTGVFEDHAGELWVATDSALNRLDRKTGKFVHYRHDPVDLSSFSGGGFGNIVEDKDHFLWIGTTGGIERLDPERRRFEHFTHIPDDPNSLQLSFGYQILLDKSGNIWASGNGIDKLNPRQMLITAYRHDERDKNTLGGGMVAGLVEDHSGRYWFATTEGLDMMDSRTHRFQHYRHDPADPASLPVDEIKAVAEDDEGMIWVCSWKGTVDRLDPRTGKFAHYIGQNGRFPNAKRLIYHGLYIDRQGILWIAEASSGVTALDYKHGKVQHYGHDPANPEGMSDYQANTICEDSKGFIWIGHGSIATDRLDPRTGRFRHYRYMKDDPGSISSNCVKVIMRDRKGRMWFGTLGGGLCLYNDSTDRFTTYTERDGLLDNSVNSIVEDAAGYLWLGTGKGMCRFSPDEKRFTFFDYPNSPASSRVVFFFCRGSDGKLCFSQGGVKAFDPGALKPNPYIPPVVITRFKLFDQQRPFSNDTRLIELSHDQNFFSFEFSALNFSDPRKNQYAYMLDGVDKEWVYCGLSRSADYTALAPGHYTFHVKASNSQGLWNEGGAAVNIVIYPPWWRTWWAWCFYVLCVLSCVWLIDRQRRRRLIEKERERVLARELEMQALRAQMNPHFIFNCLTSINRFILKHDMLSASDYLTKFSRLIRMVLNHSKQPVISLEDELEMLKLYLDMEKLRFKEAFVYCITIGEEVDASGIFIPPLLLQPFVENAIWHGLMHKDGQGRLEIGLRVEGEVLVCNIVDDGVGRIVAAAVTSKSAEKQKSMGIGITRQRLALANGNETGENGLAIEDLYDGQGKPAGTKVTLRIRVREAIDRVR